MKLLRIALFTAGVGLLSVGVSPVADARPRVTIKVAKAVVQGRTVVISGDAEGLPNGVLLKTKINFHGTMGIEHSPHLR